MTLNGHALTMDEIETTRGLYAARGPIYAIKYLREVTRCGLKEAYDAVHSDAIIPGAVRGEARVPGTDPPPWTGEQERTAIVTWLKGLAVVAKADRGRAAKLGEVPDLDRETRERREGRRSGMNDHEKKTDAAYEALNQEWAALEELLRERFVTPASVLLYADPQGVSKRLAWVNGSGAWQIVVVEADASGQTPIRNCPIEVRLSAALVAGDLVRAVVDAQDGRLIRTRAAVDHLRDVIREARSRA